MQLADRSLDETYEFILSVIDFFRFESENRESSNLLSPSLATSPQLSTKVHLVILI